MKKNLILIGLACMMAVWQLTGCSPTPASSKPQVEEAKVPMSRVAGTYRHSDGVKQFTITEVFSEDGWNGIIHWEPAIGDWAKPVRCRISGRTVLAVEIPAPSKTFIAAMFTLVDGNTIRGEAAPWAGEFKRVRR